MLSTIIWDHGFWLIDTYHVRISAEFADGIRHVRMLARACVYMGLASGERTGQEYQQGEEVYWKSSHGRRLDDTIPLLRDTGSRNNQPKDYSRR